MTGLLGAALTTAIFDDDLRGITVEEPYVHLGTANGFRMTLSIVLLATQLPALATFIVAAQVPAIELAIKLNLNQPLTSP